MTWPAVPSFVRCLAALAIITMTTLSATSEAGEQWRLIHDEAGIRVYTQPVAGSSFVEFKGETEVGATLQQCAGLLLSVSHMTRWMHGTKKVQVLSAASPLDRVLYMINDAPFPLRDRDLVVHNVLTQREDNTVIYSIELLPERARESKYVHVARLKAQATMTPISSYRTRIEYRAHVDPGGIVPAWAVNMFVLDTPLKTLQQAKALIEQTKGTLLAEGVRNQP